MTTSISRNKVSLSRSPFLLQQLYNLRCPFPDVICPFNPFFLCFRCSIIIGPTVCYVAVLLLDLLSATFRYYYWTYCLLRCSIIIGPTVCYVAVLLLDLLSATFRYYYWTYSLLRCSIIIGPTVCYVPVLSLCCVAHQSDQLNTPHSGQLQCVFYFTKKHMHTPYAQQYTYCGYQSNVRCITTMILSYFNMF